jgi:hypothetical protein
VFEEILEETQVAEVQVVESLDSVADIKVENVS